MFIYLVNIHLSEGGKIGEKMLKNRINPDQI